MTRHRLLTVTSLLMTAMVLTGCSATPAPDASSSAPSPSSSEASAPESAAPPVTVVREDANESKVAVIDASSSKTRLYLYSVVPGPYPLVTNLKETEFKRTPSGADEDGIDNFVDPTDVQRQAQVIPEIITPLLDDLRSSVTALNENPADVEVNLLATAGMRVAEVRWTPTYPSAIADFYALIRAAITDAGFAVGEVRTSDGSAEEGLWSWVNDNDVLVSAFSTQSQPVGVVEVGGSSAQISYPTQEPVGSSNVYGVMLNGRSFRVFSRTYLGLGVDDARKEMRQTSPSPQSCFATGLPKQEDAGETQPGYPTLPQDGAYDAQVCATDFAAVVRRVVTETGDPGIASSIGDFIGTDATFYAMDDFSTAQTPKALSDAATKRCAAPADQLLINFPDIATSATQQRECPMANYISTLLFDPSVGLFRDRPETFLAAVTSRSATGSTVLTWTRGFLLLRFTTAGAR